ncbi:MAG: conjugative transposon protein TraM [Candidatus Amoebophilus sp.]
MKHLNINNKKRLIIISITLSMGIGWHVLRSRTREVELPYKAPNLAPISHTAVERTKYEEYEAILENKHKNKQPKKSLVRFGLAKLFKPHPLEAPTKKPLAAKSTLKQAITNKQPAVKSQAPTYFFAYQGEEKKTSNITREPAHFFKARVHKEQKVRDKGSVVVKLQEKLALAEKTLPPGTLLFGAAKFGKDRMYVTFTVAKWQEEHIPIQLEGYDQDLLLGWSVPGLVPSLGDQVEEKALQKALHYSSSGILEDLGKGAIETLREVKKKKEAFLEDRKGVYVRLSGKKKS